MVAVALDFIWVLVPGLRESRSRAFPVCDVTVEEMRIWYDDDVIVCG